MGNSSPRRPAPVHSLSLFAFLRVSAAALLAATLAALIPPPVLAADPGTALAQKVYDRPAGRDSSVHAAMTLSEKGASPRSREMYVYRLKKGPGEVWSLIRFTSPASIDGTGLLTQDQPDSDSSQWVYLPALDQVRRITSSHKGGRFVGSDLYYEDLRDRAVKLDKHRLIGHEQVGGVMCDVLESVPVDADSSVYSKRVSWIDPKSLLPLRVDFYEGGDKPSKRMVVNGTKVIQGYQTVVDSTMTDLASGHATRIVVRQAVYDRHLTEQLFSRRTVSDPHFESRFRP